MSKAVYSKLLFKIALIPFLMIIYAFTFINVLLDILSPLARCKYNVEHHLFTPLYCIKSFGQHLTKHDESPLITT